MGPKKRTKSAGPGGGDKAARSGSGSAHNGGAAASAGKLAGDAGAAGDAAKSGGVAQPPAFREQLRSALAALYALLGLLMLLSWASTQSEWAMATVNPSWHLMTLAVVTVVVGCAHSLYVALWADVADDKKNDGADTGGDELDEGDGDEGDWTEYNDTVQDHMSEHQAYMVPVIGSGLLLGMFILNQFVPFDLGKTLITVYILFVTSISIYVNLGHMFEVLRVCRRTKALIGAGTLIEDTWQPPKEVVEGDPAGKDHSAGEGDSGPKTAAAGPEAEAEPQVAMWREMVWQLEDMSPQDFYRVGLAVALAALYWYTEHWVVNNILGVSFCLLGVKSVALPGFKIGAVMLAGLFVYDVWWVFGSEHVIGHNVMVAVAKGVEAPIKVVFPRGEGFALLGLGDIVVPALYLAMLARFDHARRVRSDTADAKPPPGLLSWYFGSGVVAYAASLLATTLVMLAFQAAQPALLYIVPFLLLCTAIVATVRGEWHALLSFNASEL